MPSPTRCSAKTSTLPVTGGSRNSSTAKPTVIVSRLRRGAIPPKPIGTLSTLGTVALVYMTLIDVSFLFLTRARILGASYWLRG